MYFLPSIPIGMRAQSSNRQSSSPSRHRHPSTPTYYYYYYYYCYYFYYYYYYSYNRVQLHLSRSPSSAETPTEGLLPESNSDRARPLGIEHSVPIAKLALLLVIATHLLPPTTPTATIATTTSSTITTRPTFILWHVHRLFRPSMPIGIRTQCSNRQSSSPSRHRHPSSPTAQRMLTTCTSTVRRGPLARASLGRNKLSYHSLSPTAKAKEGMSLTQRSAQRGRSPQSRKVFPPCRAPLPDTSPLSRTL